MATQTDVQRLIQGLTPSSSGDGNPNTAYNNSPATTGGGAGVPLVDAYGNWFTPAISPAANYTRSPLNLPTSTPIRFPHLPQLQGGGGGGTTGPTPTIPPVVTPPGGGGGGGTVTGPHTGGPLNPSTNAGGTGNGAGGYNTNWYSGPYVPPNLNNGGTGSSTGSIGGMDNFQWQELIDKGLDVIGIPGNFFLSGTNQWDVSNMLASTLSTMTGLPINTIATAIGKYGAANGWSLNNPFVDHYLDNTRNDYASKYGGLGPTVPGLTPGIAGVDFPFADLNGVPEVDLGYATVPNYGNWKPGQGGGAIVGGGTTGPRPIGGLLNFTGGQGGYNNGVGAGTGFGASNYVNDQPFGSVAAGFGIGATSSGSAGSYALADAQKAAKINKI